MNTSSTVHCPVDHTSVDVERCAACAWRSSGSATCTGSERVEAREWRTLMRLLVVP